MLEADDSYYAWVFHKPISSPFAVYMFVCDGESDKCVMKAYERVHKRKWKRIGTELPVKSGQLYMVHAVTNTKRDIRHLKRHLKPGAKSRTADRIWESTQKSDSQHFPAIGDAILYRTKPGRYMIEATWQFYPTVRSLFSTSSGIQRSKWFRRQVLDT